MLKLGSHPEPCPRDRLADGGDVGVGREAHLPALEIDGDRRGAGARRGPGDGLYAAVAGESFFPVFALSADAPPCAEGGAQNYQ